MAQQPRYKMVCPDCGSDDVSKDATVRWDVDKQAWGVTGLFDGGHCDGCDIELKRFNEVEIPLEQAVMAPLDLDFPTLRTLPTESQEIMKEDLGLPGGALDDKYNPEGDGEHPVVTRQEWREAVAQQETVSGYWDWTAHKIAVDMAPQR
jgi:hypothetical protein